MWFRFHVQYDGTKNIDVARYFCHYPHVGAGQSLLGFSTNQPPNVELVYGPYELADITTWQAGFSYSSISDHSVIPGATIHHWYDTAPSTSGPWTVLCNYTLGQYAGSNDFVLQECDFRTPFLPPGAPCAYGTELSGPGQFIFYVTPGVILDVVLKFKASWMVGIFASLAGMTIDASILCASGPPPLPAFDDKAFLWSQVYLKRVFDNMSWYLWCKCIDAPSGSPLPLPYEPPELPKPPGLPDRPTFDCSNGDICAALNRLAQQVAALNRAVAQNYEMTSLLQRYGLPMAYIVGAAHSGLSGGASFAISRLLGVRVDITSALPARQLEGTPAYIWDLGWMSIMTPEGMIEERRITRDTQVWQPQLIQEATTFGYFFKPGVEATVTELEPEP